MQRQVPERRQSIVAVRIVEGYRSPVIVGTAFGWGWDPTLVNLGFRLIPAVQGTERMARVLSGFALHAMPATKQPLWSIKKYLRFGALEL